MSDTLRLEYVPLGQALEWDWLDNPKKHDQPKIVQSILTYGFQDPPKFDPNLNGGNGGFAYGNGRVRALGVVQEQGHPVPNGIDVITTTGEWAVPILFGNDLPDRAAAEAFAVDHNNLTLGGSGLTYLDAARMYQADAYYAVHARLAEYQRVPLTTREFDYRSLIDPKGVLEAARPGEGDGDSSGSRQSESRPADVRATVGEYAFPVPRQTYTDWLEGIRGEVGFKKSSIIAEIKRRLGLCVPS